MSDNKISASLVNIEMPKSIDNAITNLTDKPTNSIGATLTDIWYLVFGGIGLEAEKRKLKYAKDLENFKLELESKIEKIPDDKKIESDIRIVAPALEASKYCVGCDEIRSLFSNLIASSMNSQISQKVHPSFVDIIKQLNQFEAVLLKHIYKNHYTIPMIRLRLVQTEDSIKNDSIFFSPISTGKGQDIIRNYGALDLEISFSIGTDELSSSFDNLERLGLITISYTRAYVNDERYLQFEKDELIKEIIEECNIKYNGNQTLKAIKGICETTDYGKVFLNVCIAEESDN